MNGPLVEVEGLTVSFGDVAVVRDVSFTLHSGRCLAVVGESGSGKSVTARTLLGLTGDGARVHAGRLAFDGRSIIGLDDRRWRSLRGAQIGYVLQDALVSLDQLRTVGAEIGESLRAHRLPGHRPSRSDRVRRTHELLDLVGVPEPAVRARQRPHELSGGLRQRALIASALAHDPRLVIADEPTTALDATVQAQILDVLADAKSRGKAVILISHDLAVVARLADDIAVMRAGEIVEYGTADDVLNRPHHEYTRTLLGAIPSRASRGTSLTGGESIDRPARSSSVPAVRATDLHKSFAGGDRHRRAAVRGVGFELYPGRTLGIVGESGSGKTTVARLVLGLTEPDSGTVELDGEPWTTASPAARRARRKHISVIYQDPLSSFDPRWNVEPILRDSVRPTGLAGRAADRRVDELMEQVGLAREHRERQPLRMSGGQRQRVAIARALAQRPSIIVCDEPVSALDVSIQARVLDLLTRLQAETGVALLFISHDLGVIHHMSDEILVMRRGVAVEHGDADEVFSNPRHPYTRELLAAVPTLAESIPTA